MKSSEANLSIRIYWKKNNFVFEKNIKKKNKVQNC